MATVGNLYSVGDKVVMSALFSDPTRITPPVDPITGHTLVNPSGGVTCVVTLPDGVTKQTVAVSVSGTLYTATITATVVGIYGYRFVGAGDFQGAQASFFQVR